MMMMLNRSKTLICNFAYVFAKLHRPRDS